MHYNDLTPAQIERLAILSEECGEVVQVIGKILRHGYESSSPVPHDLGQDSNRMLLAKEISDILLITTLMVKRGDLPDDWASDEYVESKIERLNKYFHHNKFEPDEWNR